MHREKNNLKKKEDDSGVVYMSVYSLLKLVCTNINYCVLGTSTAAIFLQMIIFSEHLLSRMNGMLYFIYMGPVNLPITSDECPA